MADEALYGHPFRGLWQQLAGDLGITTQRMHENMLDQQAQETRGLQDANMAIAQAMQGADPEQSAELAQQMRDRAQLAGNNIGAIGRGQNPLLLPTASQIVSPYYAAREQGRIGIEMQNNQRAYDLASSMRTDYQKQLDDGQTAIDKAHTTANTMLQMAGPKGLGAGDPGVQSRFKELLGANAADFNPETLKSAGPIGEIIASIFNNGEKKIYSADDITKGTAAWLTGQTQDLVARRDAVLKAAQAQGFQLADNGQLTHPLLSLNRPGYANSQGPNATNNTNTPPVPAGPPGSTQITVPTTPPGTVPPQIRDAAIGGTGGGLIGHLLGHAVLGGMLEGAGMGRAAGPLGAVVGGGIGALGGYMYGEAGNETLDRRILEVAGPNAYEQNGAIVNADGQAVPLPRGLADQVARRARARLKDAQRSVNP